MTASSRYRGQPVSEGIGTGEIYLGDAPGEADRGQPDPGEDDVRAAFAAVAQERAALAGRLRERGQDLRGRHRGHRRADRGGLRPGRPGGRRGAGRSRCGVAAVSGGRRGSGRACSPPCPTPTWPSGRATSARSPRPWSITCAGNAAPPPPAGTFILVRREVDPADLIRLADARAGRRGVGRRRGQLPRRDHRARPRPAHAGRRRPAGAGRGGRAPGDPGRRRWRADRRPRTRLAAARASAAATPRKRRTCVRPCPAAESRTADGEPVTLLCNVASAAETRLGLSGGAAGVGLLRTEIPFTGATDWPSAGRAPGPADAGPRPARRAGRRWSGCSTSPATRSRPSWRRQPGLAALLGAPGRARATSSGRSCARAATPSWPSWCRWSSTLDEVAQVRAALAEAAAEAGADAARARHHGRGRRHRRRGGRRSPAAVDFFSDRHQRPRPARCSAWTGPDPADPSRAGRGPPGARAHQPSGPGGGGGRGRRYRSAATRPPTRWSCRC